MRNFLYFPVLRREVLYHTKVAKSRRENQQMLIRTFLLLVVQFEQRGCG